MRLICLILLHALMTAFIVGCTVQNPESSYRPPNELTESSVKDDRTHADIGLNPEIPLNFHVDRIEDVSAPGPVGVSSAIGTPGTPPDAPVSAVPAPAGFGGGIGGGLDGGSAVRAPSRITAAAAVDSFAGVRPGPFVREPRDGTPRPAEAEKARPVEPMKPRPAGVLTAGSFDDNFNPRYFQTLAAKPETNSDLAALLKKMRGRHVEITIKDGDNKPLGGARVRVAAEGGKSLDLLSRTDGRVIVVADWDGFADGPLSLTVTPPDGSAAVTETLPTGVDRHVVTLSATRGKPPAYLDLAIVLDTTGSMGDEHQYLTKEFAAIAESVRGKFPDVVQRYALVVYRDEGDAYTAKRFAFTTSLDEYRKTLAAQAAGGGGDTPEAVERGLEEALDLGWKEGNVARVLFLVGDAPPHNDKIGRTMTAADGLRKKGVSIYPVACSGYEATTEMVFRSTALLSGGQFLFLTDDSGVGNAHAEPRIPYFRVQHLDNMMVRMIAGELAGKRLPADEGDVLRVVGSPPK